MKWILIYWILTQIGFVSQTATFDDQKSCDDALRTIVDDWSASRNSIGTAYGQAGGFCQSSAVPPPVVVVPTP